MFVDGASLLKTGSKGAIWAMFSTILDLPPRLRVCFKNIITHFIIGAQNIDLNEFFYLHLNGLKKLQIDNIQFEVEIKVKGIIGDLPALAKCLNMNSYRGYYSCIQCMVKGEMSNKTMIFPFSQNINLRSNDMYSKQVEKVINEEIICIGN